MSMMNVLDKSLTIICPDRNKKEVGDLRTRITEAYHTTKVNFIKHEYDETYEMFVGSWSPETPGPSQDHWGEEGVAGAEEQRPAVSRDWEAKERDGAAEAGGEAQVKK